MRMRIGIVEGVVVVAAALALAGCGREDLVDVDDDGKGSLTVTVEAINSGNNAVDFSLATVTVYFERTVEVFPEVNPQTMTLTPAGTSGQRWSGTKRELLAGDYNVWAQIEGATSNGNPVFELQSRRVPYTVAGGSAGTITLFINHQRGSDFLVPYINFISTNRPWVKPNESAVITVGAAGGQGQLSAVGLNWGAQGVPANPGNGRWTFTPGAPFEQGTTGTFQVHAGDTPYDGGFVAQVEDQDGNRAQTAVTLSIVEVGSPEAQLTFNFPPRIGGDSTVLNDYEGTWVYGDLEVTNPNDAPRDIQLVVSDVSCGGNFAPGTERTTVGITTQRLASLPGVPAGGTGAHAFLFQIPAACTGIRGEPGYTCERSRILPCEIRIEASSPASANVADGVATTSLTVMVHTELVNTQL